MTAGHGKTLNLRPSLPWVLGGLAAGAGTAAFNAIALYDSAPHPLAMGILAALGAALGWLGSDVLHTRFRQKATRRALARLGDERSYKLMVSASFNEAKRTGVPFTLLQIDIDNYLALLTRRPDAADRILHGVATVIAETPHADGFAAWLQADRFGVVARGTGRVDARALAETIRVAVEARDFGVGAPVTCSIGLSQWTFQDTLDEVIERAERSLFAAKMMGKNSISSGEIRTRPKGSRVIPHRIRVASVA